MYDLEMNNLLHTCLCEYLSTNPPIEILGTGTKMLPMWLQNQKIQYVNKFSYNSLKIREQDWAILPYETNIEKYIIGWIHNDSFIANNIPIAVAVWFNLPLLGCACDKKICYNYQQNEKIELDPLINSEEDIIYG